MSVLTWATVPAETRQLIAHFKNLSFWRSVSCAIVLGPATVPSSSNAGFDKTCYPSPKGRFLRQTGEPPFFLCLFADARSFAQNGGAHGGVTFAQRVESIESVQSKTTSKRKQAECEYLQKLQLQRFWQLGCRAAFRQTLNARAWVRSLVRQRQSFWIPIRLRVPSLVRRLARFATTLPTCADPGVRRLIQINREQSAGGRYALPAQMRCAIRAEGRGTQ